MKQTNTDGSKAIMKGCRIFYKVNSSVLLYINTLLQRQQLLRDVRYCTFKTKLKFSVAGS